jgi:hypothetical protein
MSVIGRKTLLIAGRDEQIVGYKAGENRILLGGPRMDAREVEYVPADQLTGAVEALREVAQIVDDNPDSPLMQSVGAIVDPILDRPGGQ